MKSVQTILTLALFALTISGIAYAQDKGKEVAVKGEIIDVKCYIAGMGGGRGPEHEDCAIACIKGGLPVGVVEEKTGNVYVITPAKGMKSANEALLPYVAQMVTVKGKVMEKGGSRLLFYTSVESGK